LSLSVKGYENVAVIMSFAACLPVQDCESQIQPLNRVSNKVFFAMIANDITGVALSSRHDTEREKL